MLWRWCYLIMDSSNVLHIKEIKIKRFPNTAVDVIQHKAKDNNSEHSKL